MIKGITVTDTFSTVLCDERGREKLLKAAADKPIVIYFPYDAFYCADEEGYKMIMDKIKEIFAGKPDSITNYIEMIKKDTFRPWSLFDVNGEEVRPENVLEHMRYRRFLPVDTVTAENSEHLLLIRRSEYITPPGEIDFRETSMLIPIEVFLLHMFATGDRI